MTMDGRPPQSDQTKQIIPVVEGLFTFPSSPAEKAILNGSKCPACGEYYFPARDICARCHREGTEDALLSSEGVLHSFTIVRTPPRGYLGPLPYAIGEVEMREGPLVTGILRGLDPEAFRIGMIMETTVGKLEEDAGGNEIATYVFRPKQSRGREEG